VNLIRVLNIEDTDVYKWAYNAIGPDMTDEKYLPNVRNFPKDNLKYIFLQNSKIQFMKEVCIQNPWESDYFAWIDFSISYVLRNQSSYKYLKSLSSCSFQKDTFLCVPGCWESPQPNAEELLNNICWRFCGGFCIGKRESILELYSLYLIYYGGFIKKYNKIVWEVNFWAYLETIPEVNWKPIWYKADHNDSIIKIPHCLYIESIESKIKKRTYYDYPVIESYQPMQVGYIQYQGKEYINTRYVNYWYLDSGHCKILNENGIICTTNVISQLDPDTLAPLSYDTMNEPDTIGLVSHSGRPYYGLEDIRMYVYKERLKFIATSRNYSTENKNRMIIGEHSPETNGYKLCRLIEPPEDTWCEKNWIPIVTKNGNEYFIYSWSDTEIRIGEIDYFMNKLNIVNTININIPEFLGVKGSTPFLEYNDNQMIGLVHFNEDCLPRRYYHMLVVLDKETIEPVKYSKPFYFQHLGIEFCTGFKIQNDDYYFWISKWDREPVMIQLHTSDFIFIDV
jgi:hypothetical protein